MDFIREGYPRIPEEFIDAALDYTDGDAFDTMDILDAYLRGTSQLNGIPLNVSTVSQFMEFMSGRREDEAEFDEMKTNESLEEGIDKVSPIFEWLHAYLRATLTVVNVASATWKATTQSFVPTQKTYIDSVSSVPEDMRKQRWGRES